MAFYDMTFLLKVSCTELSLSFKLSPLMVMNDLNCRLVFSVINAVADEDEAIHLYGLF